MSRQSITLDAILYSILVETDFDNFTVTALRDRYVEAVGSSAELDLVEIRRIAYTAILKLVDKDLLVKVPQKHVYKTRYQKTIGFKRALFKKRQPRNPTMHQDTGVQAPPQPELKAQLIEKLNYYKAELLTSIGESEEYQRLLSDYPEYKPQLFPKYLSAREASTKMLGRVKAIESVLACERGACR